MSDQIYTIRQRDKETAAVFIEKQLNKDPRWPGNTDSQRLTAEQEYSSAKRDVAHLNAWCRKWLNEAQWAEIRRTIQALKERSEKKLHYSEPHKTISITHQAWKALSEIALQEQKTLSEVIISRFDKNNTNDVSNEPHYNPFSLNGRRARY